MKMTDAELKEILMEHKKWLNNEGGRRADLSIADLSGANLSRVDLSRADLSGANLRGVDFSGADLYKADLSDTDLSHANLSGAILGWVDFTWANLTQADLTGAILKRTNLSWAILSNANFSNANLDKVNFRNAELSQVDLSVAHDIPYIPMACPDAGSFIAWKKASDYIIKLLIPEDAKRSSATSRKCRANKAVVLAIENLDGTPSEIFEIQSNFDSNFIYRIGETVEIKEFCDNRFKECAAGIHFFINREEAVQYGELTPKVRRF